MLLVVFPQGVIMHHEELPPAFMAGVQLQMLLMGLTLAFKEKYGDEALEVAQGFAEKIGTMMGHRIKEQAGITGSGLDAMEKLVHTWLDPMTAPQKVETKIEGNTLVIPRDSPMKCPPMVVAKKLNVSPEMVCKTIAWPMFQGMAKAINAGATFSNVEISPQKCVDKIEIP